MRPPRGDPDTINIFHNKRLLKLGVASINLVCRFQSRCGRDCIPLSHVHGGKLARHKKGLGDFADVSNFFLIA